MGQGNIFSSAYQSFCKRGVGGMRGGGGGGGGVHGVGVACMAGEAATEARGTHPIGMHSCVTSELTLKLV